MGTLSSFHPGGGLVSMADASVRFVSQTINTGNQAFPDDGTTGAPTPPWPNNNRSGISPYGVWGAMGSRTGGEAFSNQ